jgi:superfamily II DNA/RNA helicase
MPAPIVSLARKFMVQPTHVRAHGNDEGSTVPQTRQLVYRAHALDKIEILARILQARERDLMMVFCRTKRTAAKVAEELEERGFAAAAVHGDLGQGAREQAMRAFRSGKVGVLIATDVAARGIDVTGVSHVINYQCPEDEKVYVHRIGRTGRAGGEGTAVTFVDWDEIPRWQLINKALGLDFDEPVETYSRSPHLYADLDIPDEAAGTLPRTQRKRAGLDAEQLEDVGETGRSHNKPRGRRGDEPEVAERPRRRTPRVRRRTRGGKPVDGSEVVEAPTTEAVAEQAADGQAVAEQAEAPVERTPRRRRRRSGRGRSAATSDSPAMPESSAVAEADS